MFVIWKRVYSTHRWVRKNAKRLSSFYLLISTNFGQMIWLTKQNSRHNKSSLAFEMFFFFAYVGACVSWDRRFVCRCKTETISIDWVSTLSRDHIQHTLVSHTDSWMMLAVIQSTISLCLIIATIHTLNSHIHMCAIHTRKPTYYVQTQTMVTLNRNQHNGIGRRKRCAMS